MNSSTEEMLEMVKVHGQPEQFKGEYNIDKSAESSFYRMCSEKRESVGHIVSECSKLAQREYKKRHDNVARYVHWKLCRKNSFERGEK